MRKFLTIVTLFFFSGISIALPLPEADKFEIKDITDKKVLYVSHTKDKGHISSSLIKLIQYYLLEESQTYKVVFPQLSVESKNIEGSYYAIGYEGIPKETNDIKTTKLKGGLFASFIFKGNYRSISPAIRSTFKKVLNTENFIPHPDEEIRLLYWNSIDDNHPKDLITEIQIRVKKRP